MPSVRQVVVAGTAAAVLSGGPSTAWAVITGGDVLAAGRAAGTLWPGARERPGLIRGLAVHTAVSAWWTLVFALIGRRRPLNAVSGAAGGLAIATFDLLVVGRRYPAIAELAQLPQWADHVAFGTVAGHLLRAD